MVGLAIIVKVEVDYRLDTSLRDQGTSLQRLSKLFESRYGGVVNHNLDDFGGGDIEACFLYFL
ncbi:predicted protein [Sclerotinia sclerotiorum 1980 UF-70]|uniref:Uncharacterized protein n=1 Tax=Sclerotinia sclerotiorum (strain ATCC 18683 / 1980 / Ss-1) TaxID=665079 RepID=A7EG87_SCLS1|nr:predicted protein [Sclerotinia sclerotiorum 1980 UF-70]EDO01853.1 predicted protein [Sclerotinia sclerotiorum 1980 UF-70]